MRIDRTVEHDRGTGIEQRQQGLDLEVGALDVGVEALVPQRPVDIGERRELRAAGVDEYCIEAYLLADQRGSQLLRLGDHAGVVAQRDRAGTQAGFRLGQCGTVAAGDDGARAFGDECLGGGQATLAVPSMRAKVLAQRDGLGVGWLPRHRASALLKSGQLVEKKMSEPREPNTLYVAWRSDHEGRVLGWWLEQLRQPRLAKRLIQGLEIPA